MIGVLYLKHKLCDGKEIDGGIRWKAASHESS